MRFVCAVRDDLSDTSAMLSSPLHTPLAVPESAQWVAFRLSESDAHAILSKEIFERWFGPADAKAARVEPTERVHVPFWRIDVSVDGSHVGFTNVTVGREGAGFRVPIPYAGKNSKEGIVMVSARRAFPHKPTLPAIFGGESTAFDVKLHEMSATAQDSRTAIDADVSEAQATEEASRLLLNAAEPQRALLSNYKPTIRSATFVYYPIYFTPYRYVGEAAPEANDSYFVAISGHDGKVLASHHPSKFRSAAAKVRRLLSFDWASREEEPSPLSERARRSEPPKSETTPSQAPKTPEKQEDPPRFRIKLD
jgi:hypothetical protein